MPGIGAHLSNLSRHASLRYAVNGAICAAINNAILIVGDRLGAEVLFLIFLTWLIGGSAGFALHSGLSFRARLRWAGYAQFMAGIAVGIPLAYVLILALTEGCDLPMAIAAPVMTVVMIFYNYLNARWAIGRSRSAR